MPPVLLTEKYLQSNIGCDPSSLFLGSSLQTVHKLRCGEENSFRGRRAAITRSDMADHDQQNAELQEKITKLEVYGMLQIRQIY